MSVNRNLAGAFGPVVMFVYLPVLLSVEVPPPQNVEVITLNTHYTLSWEWSPAQNQNHSVTFTVQYLSMYKWDKLNSGAKNVDWSDACPQTSHTHCDLTRLRLHYLGIYMLRVQARLGPGSKWVLKEFCPDKDAVIGPPSRVDLVPVGSHLDINIADPMTSSNTSMRDEGLRPDIYYSIYFWERDTDQQGVASQMLTTHANLVTLSDLKAWTMYCVRVQSRYDFYNKSSVWTPPLCAQTEGVTPWWQILLYFLLALVICFLLVLALLYGVFRCYKTLKATLFPSVQLPAHLQEYLYDLSPSSDIPRLLSPDSESVVICDEICPQAVLLEVHCPAPSEELDPDSSGRHSRQDSGGSRDSGVYSTEGSSGPRLLHSGQTLGGEEDSGQEVKMHDLHLKVKGQRPIIDEGVVDMCV
ncbi:interferon alpha/beta receptor 1b-like isoform X2 [Genypterus blacodes]|uniref:interferon alpha/beta receptor 1b-like isoform X2 n=1 Tax=Genypterus blacodes TaxID=154954 RepID=UPI003F77034C